MATIASPVSSITRPTANTSIGLCIALFALTDRQVFGDQCRAGTALLTSRGLVMFASVVALLLLVRRGEKIPLGSVG